MRAVDFGRAHSLNDAGLSVAMSPKSRFYRLGLGVYLAAARESLKPTQVSSTAVPSPTPPFLPSELQHKGSY